MEYPYNTNNYYEVEKIITRKKLNGKIFYLVKWEGYSVNESTWEPISNLKNIQYMIKDFENDYPKSIDKKLIEIFQKKYTPVKQVKSFQSNLLKKKKLREKTTKNKENEDFFKKNKNDELDLLKEHLYIKTKEKNIENADQLNYSNNLMLDLSEMESLEITNESQKECVTGDNIVFKNFDENEKINIIYENHLIKPSVIT